MNFTNVHDSLFTKMKPNLAVRRACAKARCPLHVMRHMALDSIEVIREATQATQKRLSDGAQLIL